VTTLDLSNRAEVYEGAIRRREIPSIAALARSLGKPQPDVPYGSCEPCGCAHARLAAGQRRGADGQSVLSRSDALCRHDEPRLVVRELLTRRADAAEAHTGAIRSGAGSRRKKRKRYSELGLTGAFWQLT